MSPGEAVDERDIEPVERSLRRVTEQLADLRASAGTMPQTPDWKGPTRWTVDRRIDEVHRAIERCHRLAEASWSSAQADLERARRMAEERSEWGLWA